MIFSLLLCSRFNTALAQDKNKRPSLGLALSGGGALGMAHVGVLKVMEEAGLRPDYITGVSMGSIVGAMYSLGYSADSLHSIFKNTNWNLVLSNNVPENKVIFTEKKFFNNSIISLPISSSKVRLPSGLINGQQIEKMLSYYAWPSARINDFSKLPIPFLCLGTDLVTCSKVVIRNGYLPDAIRASMAVPSAFTPLKIDTAVIIDGGFVRNIAITELKEMGADIVIGSYTGFERNDEEELQSITGILKQLSFFNSILDFAEQRKMIDYLIEPDHTGLSSMVFTNADTIIQRGYRSAEPFREKFRRLADSLNRLGPQKPQEVIENREDYVFDRIEINGNNVIPDDQITGLMEISPGIPVTRDYLSEQIDLLYGRAWFDKVKYSIRPRNDSLVLVLECNEKPQSMLYASVHYDNYLREGAIVNLSLKNLLSHRSSVDIESYIGQFYRFSINLTQFIGKNQNTALSLSSRVSNTELPYLTMNDETGRFFARSFTQTMSINKRAGLNNLMTIYLNYKNLNLIPDFIPVNKFNRVSFNTLSGGYQTEVNSIDRKYFPDRGILFQASVNTSKLVTGRIKTNFSKLTYREDQEGPFNFRRAWSLKTDYRHFISPSAKVSFSYGGNILLTYTSDSLTSPQNYYYLGGNESTTPCSVPMTGFNNNEIAVDQIGLLRFDTDIEFRKDLYLSIMTNAAIARETLAQDPWTFLGGYGIGIGYNSVIGPFRAGIMQGFSNNERFFGSVKGYISIGFTF
ncbi:MAG: patatin-like phospholipase family protein [Bacteroidales bacterium]|jgi:NTE family protein|nr:patatin-like phospholipase family protein [Bacteroidales bacterium]